MKFVLFSDGMSPHTYKWATELNQRFDLYLISLGAVSEELFQLLGKDKIKAFNLLTKTEGGNWNKLFKVYEIVQYLKKIQSDYIHAHYVTSYGFISAFIKKFFLPHTKLILSAWGSDILVTPARSKVYREITRFAIRHANLVTSDSFYMADKIASMVKNASIVTFPFGVDAIPECSYQDKDENLIYSNRALSRNYNIDQVIRWFSTLVKTDPQKRLVISNDGEMRKDLFHLAQKLGVADYIKFVGFLDKNAQEKYYLQARYYISIPSSDSTSVSLIEAMSYGCIPIVSNIPANREWVIDL